MAMANLASSAFAVWSGDSYEINQMVLDESKYAVIYVEAGPNDPYTWVYVKRTKETYQYTDEALAFRDFKAMNVSEQQYDDDLNQKDQAEKERTGYGEW